MRHVRALCIAPVGTWTIGGLVGLQNKLTFIVILNLFQDNEPPPVILKQVQDDGLLYAGPLPNPPSLHPAQGRRQLGILRPQSRHTFGLILGN